MGKPRVLIACPNGDGWLHKLVVFSVLNMLQDSRVEATFIAPTNRPYVHNLHKVALDVLSGSHDFLLTLDDDNPPTQNVMDLVGLDLDVVGCPTPVWHCDTSQPDQRPYYFNAMREAKDPETDEEGFLPVDSDPGFEPTGLHEVDAVGTGCVLIARRVLESLMARARESGDPMDAPFMRRWTSQGLVHMGNDYAFSQRARAAGFKVWAHFDYTCRHVNEVELLETITGLLRFRLGRDDG